MTDPRAGLFRDATSVLSKRFGQRQTQRVTPTESSAAVFLATAISTFAGLVGASYWWLRRQRH